MTVVDTEPTAVRAPRRLLRGRWWRLNYLGLVFSLVSLLLTARPSLLPRGWLYEGALTGIGAAVGYGIGVGISWMVRRLGFPEPGRAFKRIAWVVLFVVGPIAFAIAVVLGERAQNTVRRLVGVDETAVGHIPTIMAIALTVVLVLVLLARGLRLINRGIAAVLSKVIPRPLARLIALLLLLGLGYVLVTDAAKAGFTAWADDKYAPLNDGSLDTAVKPTVSTRSAGPGSPVSWESLGFWGRAFIGRGPDAAKISAFNGKPAKEPIRVYVGLETKPTAQERAALAVEELVRTKAFERKVLVVAGATGMGWVDPQSIDPVEYIWGGDTAVASIQYSYLPSWVSFLVDKERASEAGRALFEAVYAKWSTLPEGERPKLIAYGLSLGSFAVQSAFGSVQDMAARTDGAVFFGSPNFAEPWGTVVAERDPGSPQWKPIYKAGETARFAATQGDFDIGREWPAPRVVFMQHASDPIVWWTPDLLFERPDWLREPRGPDVSPATRWFPLVTFLQVTVDQFFATSVPIGHGHNYGDATVYAWENVLAPNDWNTEKSARLQEIISAYPLE